MTAPRPENPPKPGETVMLAPDLARIIAPNPSPMTYWGTNTYLLGQGALAVIDPGPDDPVHLARLLAAIADRPVSHIIVTHSHLDHSPLAHPLAAATGAPVYGYGDSLSGRSPIMARLAASGFAGGGEGMDRGFEPDHTLRDGDILRGAGWLLRALHTPGHIGNHLCLHWGDAIFTGDHVMGWSTSLVSPPDGDMTDFMASCEKLRSIPAEVYYPGHGAPVLDPAGRVADLLAHRSGRSDAILAALGAMAGQGASCQQLTQTIYHDIAPALHAAANRNVFAHLIDLCAKGLVTADPQLADDATFRLGAGQEPDEAPLLGP